MHHHESNSRGVRTGASRRSSKSSPLRSLRNLLKPIQIVRGITLLLVGRLLYSHFRLLSESSTRSLWQSAPSTNTAVRLFEVVLAPFHQDELHFYAAKTPTPVWLAQRREDRAQQSRPTMKEGRMQPSLGATGDGSPILDVSNQETTDWKSLCKEANMNSGSRILIVNMLSHPTGASVARLIARQCRVAQLVGADPLLPNLRRSRMELLTLQKDLMRVIPQMLTVVTIPGMGLHEKNRLQPLAWLEKARPTHVLVLDPAELPVLVESLGGLPAFQLYALQELRQIWRDLTSTAQKLPVRILHVGGPLLGSISQPLGLAAISQWDRNIPFSFSQLALGHLEGPGVHDQYAQRNSTAPFHVEQGLRAILTGWQRPEQFFTVQSSWQALTSEKRAENIIWDAYLENPFSLEAASADKSHVDETRQRLQTYGADPVALPCASQCQNSSSLRMCEASIWDQAIDPSRIATRDCTYALYMANFSTELIEAPPHPIDENLCRVLYISKKSKLAKSHKPEPNGQVSMNGWKLVWLDVTEKSYTANDSAFLRIDPSRLFHPTVRKAMHVNSISFASAPDQALLHILEQIDRPAVREGERRYRENRHGTELRRWKALPAEPARRVALFVGIPLQERRPETLLDYKSLMENAVSARQIAFYQQLSHWIHVNIDRPEGEIRETAYLKFPFEWTSRYFLVHDLTLESARQLRCEWLEEHWTWNPGPKSYWDSEDLSLAYVLGARKTLQEIGLPTEDPEFGWLPFWNNEQEPLLEGEGEDQVFLRLMQPREN
jgi:hypothetical protein